MTIPITRWFPEPDRMTKTVDRERASWYKMALYNTLAHYKPKVCLEIGTNKGGSARVFHDYFCDYRKDGLLVTCDIVKWCEISAPRVKQVLVYPHSVRGTMDYKNSPKETQLPDWEGHVETSVQDNIRIIRDASEGEFYDFAFVDGDHYWNGVDRDWKIVNGVCRKGSAVVFDDILDIRSECRDWYMEKFAAGDRYEFQDWPVFAGIGLTTIRE